MKKRYIRHASELVTCKGKAPKHEMCIRDRPGVPFKGGYGCPAHEGGERPSLCG